MTTPEDDRRHLTPGEVQKLIAATQGSRNAARDRCLLLLMFRHGLRVRSLEPEIERRQP